MVSPAYLRLSIFLPAILIPACVSSSPAFLMMYSAYKLNNRVTIYNLNILLSQFGTSSLFHVRLKLLLLDLHTDFSGGRSGGLVFPSLEEFSTVFVIHTVKDFSIVTEAEEVFLELSCFFYDPAYFGNWISCSSAFSKFQLEHLEFLGSSTVEAILENFEHYSASM